MFEKVRVNGRSQHPLYAELTKTADAEGKAGKVKWNFEKFVVTPSGACTASVRKSSRMPPRSSI